MTDPIELQSTTAEILTGMAIGGADAPIPPAIAVVVSLDELARPVHDPRVTEARHPFPDSRWHPADAATAPADNVLIRCRHGINRSALVAGLVLREHGWDGEDVIDGLRRARRGALNNPYFLAISAIGLTTQWGDVLHS